MNAQLRPPSIRCMSVNHAGMPRRGITLVVRARPQSNVSATSTAATMPLDRATHHQSCSLIRTPFEE